VLQESVRVQDSRYRSVVRVQEKTGKDAILNINIAKMKTLFFRTTDKETPIVIRDEEIENVAEFVCLGSLVTSDNDCTKYI